MEHLSCTKACTKRWAHKNELLQEELASSGSSRENKYFQHNVTEAMKEVATITPRRGTEVGS